MQNQELNWAPGHVERPIKDSRALKRITYGGFKSTARQVRDSDCNNRSSLRGGPQDTIFPTASAGPTWEMPLTAAVAVGLSFLLDTAIGEPPDRLHPVAWFGRVVNIADREWKMPRVMGVLIGAVLPGLPAGVVGGLVLVVQSLSPTIASITAGLFLFTATSLRALLSAAESIVAASETDLPGARQQLPTLVGRDPADLSAAETRSAAVESAAENLADGLVAPLAGFALAAAASTGTMVTAVFGPGTVSGTLAVATAVAWWIKGVNTLDSMLGYRSEPVGWASARLDDLVMFVPARVSAVLIVLAAARPWRLSEGRKWAGIPASPNSGWPMAALAAVLTVRLEKPGAYVMNRDRSLPTVSEAQRGIVVVRRAGLAAYALAGVVAWS